MTRATLSGRQRAVLAQILRLIAPSYPQLEAETQAAVLQDVTRYVASQIQGMPGHLRLPYKLALIAFNWLALLRYLRSFIALPEEAKRAYLAMWNDAPIGPMRDFVKLIRSSGLLVYYDHPLIMQRLEAERQLPGSARAAETRS
jgi:hypothetical protein